MNIQIIKITDIKPYANNPRKNDGVVDAVTNSIRLLKKSKTHAHILEKDIPYLLK